MTTKTRALLSILVFFVAGWVTRMIQEERLPGCLDLPGEFLNCVSPTPELWPQVAVGVLAAAATWFLLRGRRTSA